MPDHSSRAVLAVLVVAATVLAALVWLTVQ